MIAFMKYHNLLLDPAECTTHWVPGVHARRFDDYLEPLKIYLLKFREVESDKVGGSRGEDGKLTNPIVGPTIMPGHPDMGMAGIHGLPGGYGEAMGNTMYMHQR